MRASVTIRILLLATLIAAAWSPREAKADVIGTYRDWSAYAVAERDSKLCYIVSEPKAQEGNYSRRGKAAAFVSRLLTRPPRLEVNVQPGYSYKPGVPIELVIDGGKKFELFSQGEHAWAKEGEDQALIDAMKAGSRMTVRGTSTRDTFSLDTYSLAGFTAAFNAMMEACKDAPSSTQRR